MPTLKTIKLSEIAGQIDHQTIDEAQALRPAGVPDEPVIVSVESCGRISIVDGFHRTAGQIKWCGHNDVALTDCEITVVACDDAKDAELIKVAADPFRKAKQEAAIERIYVLAGVIEGDEDGDEE